MAKSSKTSTGLILKKPVSFWNREMKMDVKKAFITLSKAAVATATLNITGLVTAGISSISVFSFKDAPGQAAWLLIYRSYMATLEDVLEEYHDCFRDIDDTKIDHEKIAETLSHNMDQLVLSIELDFFKAPEDFSFLADMDPAIGMWLKELLISDTIVAAMQARIRSRFALALHNQWRKDSSNYKTIETVLNSPFIASTRHHQEWEQYKAWLKDQTGKRMFGEAFGLKEVFVPLRAYYNKNPKNKQSGEKIQIHMGKQNQERHVVDLETAIVKWAKKFNAEDCIRIISGGPGSGKSSCSKMLAVKLGEQYPDLPIIYVPLHQFDASADLSVAMEKFIASDRFLGTNPLDAQSGEIRLLVIFDGLDELSMQGKAAAETALHFIDEVKSKSERFNGQGLQRQFLITGRELAVQAGQNRFRQTGQVLHLLPYAIQDPKTYKGSKKTIEVDQRDIWWQKYSTAKQFDYSELPSDLDIDDLTDITKEPLLNYLVALSYERKKLDFSKTTTLNEIYDDMLEAVFEREYEHRPHHALGTMELANFNRVLEEIALTVWHGNGRRATLADIEKYCEASGLRKFIENFKSQAGSGVTRLLAAFYFRQSSELTQGEKTFEFTHKSFGEFLTAKRIVRLVKQICNGVAQNNADPDEGYGLDEALIKWAKLCGPTAIDNYLFRFLEREIPRQCEDIKNWQNVFASLLERAVNKRSPMEKIGGLSFREMEIQSRNAEEAILAVHHILASNSETNSKFNWNSSTSFGAWLKKVQGQSASVASVLAMECLSYLNLRKCQLDVFDLYCADLKHTNLQRADLYSTNLFMANLQEANLRNAILVNTDLTLATLDGAKLDGANLENARLKAASLIGANLKNVNLEGANLEDTNLEGADLRNANLKGHNLKDLASRGAILDDPK